MRERTPGRVNLREILTSFRNRVFGAPAAPPETPKAIPDERRMWEVLNVIPITEVAKLSPEQRSELERKREKELMAELEFQASLNQTVSEFFGLKSATPRRSQT